MLKPKLLHPKRKSPTQTQKFLWIDSILFANYLIKHLFIRENARMIPYQKGKKLYNQSPNLSCLETKSDSKTTKYIIVGYFDDTKAY